jgi:choline dehydrogenase
MRNGLRWSAKKGYLNPVRKRRNLYVMRHTTATGLVMDGKTVTGVTVSRAGKTETLTANAEVILAAGAFQSPQLLELSGIGDSDILSRHGIQTIHALTSGWQTYAGSLHFPHFMETA